MFIRCIYLYNFDPFSFSFSLIYIGNIADTNQPIVSFTDGSKDYVLIKKHALPPKWNQCELALRSSHQRCSLIKGVLRNFAKFRKDLRPATLLKKRLWHRCFPVNFAKFLRTPFLQNTSGRLLLALLRHKYSVYTQVKYLLTLQLGLCSASQISPVSIISLISICFMLKIIK